MSLFIPRPAQERVLAYTDGKMGVSAVPGSGKTYTLSALAAQLVASGVMEDDQEVLVVTLVNSAVDNFKQRINDSVRRQGLLTGFGSPGQALSGSAAARRRSAVE